MISNEKLGIKNAIDVLRNGGIVIFPTDTAFGIGCRIDKESSVKKLFEIRRRPKDKAVPVLVSSIEMAKKYVQNISPEALSLMKKYWPGALTLVIKCKVYKVPSLVRGGGDTIGVRMPNSSTVLGLIEKTGVPILGPSANFAGGKTPYKFEDLDPNLVRLTDFVIPGETSLGNISTVLDTTQNPWKILRQGAISIQNSKIKSQNYKSKVKIGLIIETVSSEVVKVGLIINGKELIKKRKMDKKKREIVLEMIDELLKKHKIKLEELSSIEVNRGPGSFTGIRVGIAIANALGFALKIPVNAKEAEVEPVYD